MHDEQIYGIPVICKFSILTVGIKKTEGRNNTACAMYNAEICSSGIIVNNGHFYIVLCLSCNHCRSQDQPVRRGAFNASLYSLNLVQLSTQQPSAAQGTKVRVSTDSARNKMQHLVKRQIHSGALC